MHLGIIAAYFMNRWVGRTGDSDGGDEFRHFR
jgi:hypothetical protein